MAEQHAPLEISSVAYFGPEMRRAGLRLIAAADGSSDLGAAVAEIVDRPDLHGILAFLGRFAFGAVCQCHGQQSDRTAAFILDELDIAEFALKLDRLEVG